MLTLRPLSSLRKLITLGNILFHVLGIIGGEHYSHSGGGSNYLCLPRIPKQTSRKMATMVRHPFTAPNIK